MTSQMISEDQHLGGESELCRSGTVTALPAALAKDFQILDNKGSGQSASFKRKLGHISLVVKFQTNLSPRTRLYAHNRNGRTKGID